MSAADRDPDRFPSRDPSQVSASIMQEIICRLLVNLPMEEKMFPRVFYNIKEACWFFADNYWTVPPEVTTKYEKKFAQHVFRHWSYLTPYLPRFGELWADYQGYRAKIPSFGAAIFNKERDHLLFIIYHNLRDKIVKMLDFPKGKAN
mmetsp:Transcript_32752/g.23676  ORF Transcript_32752/g.23676 Transcript_32752/m.23676 type:complete len:147 (-) Transcript_32752:1728-2168(-)